MGVVTVGARASISAALYLSCIFLFLCCDVHDESLTHWREVRSRLVRNKEVPVADREDDRRGGTQGGGILYVIWGS